MAVYRLEPDSVCFPDPAEADGECDGLLAVGGDIKILVYSVVVPCNTH